MATGAMSRLPLTSHQKCEVNTQGPGKGQALWVKGRATGPPTPAPKVLRSLGGSICPISHFWSRGSISPCPLLSLGCPGTPAAEAHFLDAQRLGVKCVHLSPYPEPQR